jgi:uncharacterized protein YecE (DUF72 family)
LPSGYEYALEFRHPSWQTEGPWELLRHYNVAVVMTDSPDPSLQYLSNVTVTADHAFIRFHGRNKGFWYNYAYSKEELKPWVAKVNKIVKDPKVKRLRIYFNNHQWGNAVDNAIQFIIESGQEIAQEQGLVQNRIKTALKSLGSQTKIGQFTA